MSGTYPKRWISGRSLVLYYKDYPTAAVPSALDLNEGRFEQPPATIIASRRLRAPKNICVH